MKFLLTLFYVMQQYLTHNVFFMVLENFLFLKDIFLFQYHLIHDQLIFLQSNLHKHLNLNTHVHKD